MPGWGGGSGMSLRHAVRHADPDRRAAGGRGAQCRARQDDHRRASRAIPARSIPTSAAGSPTGTWTAGAALPAIKLLAIGRNTANRITTDRQGQPVSIAWKANMWANINRTGHGNEFHSHPGSFWSAVYYVDDGGIDADPALGGELEFMDPRGPGPAMYAPQLAFGSAGLSVGANETVRPKSGRLVMFPAWLLHQVRPYKAQRRAHLHRLQSQPVTDIGPYRRRRRRRLGHGARLSRAARRTQGHAVVARSGDLESDRERARQSGLSARHSARSRNRGGDEPRRARAVRRPAAGLSGAGGARGRPAAAGRQSGGDLRQGHRGFERIADAGGAGAGSARPHSRIAVGTELRGGGGARPADRDQHRDPRSEHRPRSCGLARGGHVPAVLDARRAGRGAGRRGEERAGDRRRHRRGPRARPQRDRRADHPRLRRDGAARPGDGCGAGNA